MIKDDQTQMLRLDALAHCRGPVTGLPNPGMVHSSTLPYYRGFHDSLSESLVIIVLVQIC